MTEKEKELELMTEKISMKMLFEDQQKARLFLKKFEQEDLSYREMLEIYRRNWNNKNFERTNVAAVVLVLLPGFTNIYYTFRKTSSLSNVMSFSMPVVCLTVYAYYFLSDMKRFIREEISEDSQKALQKFKFIYLERPEGIHIEKWLQEVGEQRKIKMKELQNSVVDRVRLQLQGVPVKVEEARQPTPLDLMVMARKQHYDQLFYCRHDEPIP